MRPVVLFKISGHTGRHHSIHDARSHLEHRYGAAEIAAGRRGFEPDVAAADDHDAGAGPQLRPQRRRVG
jgi:hypothetical protein